MIAGIRRVAIRPRRVVLYMDGMRELIVRVSDAAYVKGVGRFPDGRALVVPAPSR